VVYLILGIFIGVSLAGYRDSGKSRFLYIGPDRYKYEDSFIGILTKGR
jgi:hypothetical protein